MSSTLRKDDKIMVVYGGDSAEREPSVRSGLAVYRALKKYTPGLSRQIIPARISEEERRLVRDLCSRIFRLGRLRGCARIDMIVDKVQGPMVLEVNTLPAMTETSALPAAAKAAGISMEELTERIAMSAMRQPPSASIAETTSLLQQRCF